MIESTRIGSAGEFVTTQALKDLGFTITVWDTKNPGSSDIEAVSGNKQLLVQVKSAVSPNMPPSMADNELQNIRNRANQLGSEAWLASVVLDSQLAPLSIAWSKLN